ncbi:CS1 type fimbrial major subunit [Erwinia rhapontici]|uniref:CS1 type fimbrial major subunit n=1 Tax=Erwinia TaxID=551 RepID=UPI0018D5E68F|nr:CS1 type fimbrial major subunit [Erwinia rhapontici]
MKLSNIALAMAMTLSFAGAAHAATKTDSVSKKITLTAQINDGMFVSKPDGSSWYNTEELEPTDYKQKKFSKVLPIRVWTKNADFNISLAQDLKLAGPNYEMLNPVVTLGSAQGDLAVKYGTAQKVTQTVQTADGFDAIYNLTVTVDAPATPADGKPSLNGSYSGDLVMLFEPSTGS